MAASWGYETCTTNLPQTGQTEDAMSAQMAGISAQIADLRQMLGEKIQHLEAQQSEAGNELMYLRARLLDVLTLPAAPQRAMRLDRLERLNRLFRRLESLEQSVGKEQSECIRMLEVVLSAVEKNGTVVGSLSQSFSPDLSNQASVQLSLDAAHHNNESLVSLPISTQSGIVACPSPSLVSQSRRRAAAFSSLNTSAVPQTPLAQPLPQNCPREMESPVFQPTPQQGWNQHGGLTIVLDASLVQRFGQTTYAHAAPQQVSSVAAYRNGSEAMLASPVALPPPPRAAPNPHLLGISPAPHLAPHAGLQKPSQTMHSAPQLLNQKTSGELRQVGGVSQNHGFEYGSHGSMLLERPREPVNEPSFAPLHPLRPYPTAINVKQNSFSSHPSRDLPEEMTLHSVMELEHTQGTLVRQFDTQVSSLAPTVSLEWNGLSPSTANLQDVHGTHNLHNFSNESGHMTSTWPNAELPFDPDHRASSSNVAPDLRSNDMGRYGPTSNSPGRQHLVASTSAIHQPENKRYSGASHSSSASDTDTSQPSWKPEVGKRMEVTGRLSSGEEVSSSSAVTSSQPVPVSGSGQALGATGRRSSDEDASTSSEGESSPALGVSTA